MILKFVSRLRDGESHVSILQASRFEIDCQWQKDEDGVESPIFYEVRVQTELVADDQDCAWESFYIGISPAGECPWSDLYVMNERGDTIDAYKVDMRDV